MNNPSKKSIINYNGFFRGVIHEIYNLFKVILLNWLKYN